MSKVSRFGVAFVGYTANIFGLKNGREIEYATLDFVSGCAILKADGGHVVVQKRADLSAFVDDLPKHARGLRQSCGENITESNLACRENEFFISASADIDQVIRQLAKRRSEAEQVMKQAEAIGLQIKRRPYAEYIEYIRETGISRVEVHGFGVFEHGKLFFHPERRELAVRSTESENAFIVGPADGRPKLSIN